MSSTEENPVPIVGYADRLSVQQGEAIRFMISCDFPSYKAEIIRLRSADCTPKGPARQEEVVQTQISGEYKGRKQAYPHGSYGIVATDARLPALGSFSIQCWIFPTTPQSGVQGIVTSSNESKSEGLGLYIDDKGAVALMVKDALGQSEWVSTGEPLRSHNWYFVTATYDGETGTATVSQTPQRLFPGDRSAARVEKKTVQLGQVGLSHSPILIGASWGREDAGPFPIALFNGKIENPRIFSRALGAEDLGKIKAGASLREYGLDLVANWDFSQGISTDVIVDRSGYALHGKVVNYPKRAVTSHDWNGDEFDFKHAPEQYAAIHFHDDDLDDCRWDVDFTFDVPNGFRSGVYAARLESNGHTQYVPFFVRPKRGESSAKIAFLVPTLSYLAYADEHIQSDPEQRATIEFPNFEYPTRPMDKYLIKNRLHSLYDRHSDGSGVCYSSRLRPVLTIGPEYRLAILGGGRGSPHQFSADLLIIDWLEAKGFQYDVITDEDLQWEGASLLLPYKAIVSGSHHEYWSGGMLDSLEQYLNGGGRFMYMGGNGFYWVTAVDPRKPHIVEVRRWGGTQSWRSDPGEFYLSSTGEMGGLWVNRGRAPQRYVGIGFDSQGFDVNSPYKRMPDGLDPRAAFVFEGIGKDEIIGDFDSAIQEHGAAGYEIDRLDFRLGSPSSTLLLATAGGFSDNYQHVIEETDTTLPGQGGSVNPFVRADMVYCRYPKEGAVFSTGSISWSGCLYYNGYENNVSRITENVLRAFSTLEKLP